VAARLPYRPLGPFPESPSTDLLGGLIGIEIHRRQDLFYLPAGRVVDQDSPIWALKDEEASRSDRRSGRLVYGSCQICPP
ncbi:uncharacterized protein METZ01_LOCUS419465, partial [marine metagenome]